MAPAKLLDTHIHLWPSTALTPTHHTWMTSSSHPLAKRHGISDYLQITSPTIPNGAIYVETDRHLPSAAPDLSPTDSDAEIESKLRVWAKQPLEEIKFLRRVVEGKAEEGDGVVNVKDADVLKGLVVYAPFHISTRAFQIYLRLAEEAAGKELWDSKVVGFRYLLQGKAEGEVARTVGSGSWVENILRLGEGREGAGRAFDVGVDTHRDGFEGLVAVKTMILKVREVEKGNNGGAKPVRFVLNHLCKPHITTPSSPSQQWNDALQALADDKNVYMKLSGAFNEFDATPKDVQQIADALSPFVDSVFRYFPGRVMFGSDWPVCNVGGPNGESGNWKLWVEVVEAVVGKKGLSEEEKGKVWWRAGAEAYGVDL